MIKIFCILFWFYYFIEDEDDTYDDNLQTFQDAYELVFAWPYISVSSSRKTEILPSCVFVEVAW